MRKALAAVLSLLLLTGCTENEAQRSTFAMNTIISVSVYGDESGQAADSAIRLVNELSEKWSVTDEDSEIYRLNKNGAAELSAETAELIRFALEIGKLTGGALDITLYPVLREWGFTTDSYQVPADERLAELLEYTGLDKITLSGSSVSLSDGAQIDLGAVAKGYAGDLICEQLRAQGVKSALLDLGGNIHTIGTKPDGNAWRLGVRDPDGSGNIAVVELCDAAAVTSGGYERYFVAEDGQRYCHILDPKSGKPADSGLASATIIGSEGRLCDALSTAVYVMGAERAYSLWQTVGGFEMLLVTTDGDMLITEGLVGSVVPAEGFTGEMIMLDN